MLRTQPSQPRILVRREDAERSTGLSQHFLRLEDHLILAAVPSDALRQKSAFDLAVALERGRLIVSVCIHCMHLQSHGQSRNLIARTAMQNPKRTAKPAQCRGQLSDAP